jgi:UDP-N-acetylmuramyl pentapeptide phosphotransferase/UDP-N-acetylglucosamine-1-phosphate transferase
MADFFEKYSILFILPALTFFMSLVFTKSLIPFLKKFNIVAQSGERHIHKEIVPTMGGMAIITSFLVAMFFAYFSPWKAYLETQPVKFEFLKLFIPLIILIPAGIFDDKFELRARYKFLFQIITGAISWLCGAKVTSILGIAIPEYISFVVTVLWIVSFINAFNLIDGLDGLASGISIVSAVCLSAIYFLSGDLLYTLILLCIAASCLGFLRYNFYPAKIFMGDTGSMFLGYMFAAIGLLSSNKSGSFSAIAIPILACGVPLMDTFLAIWRRVTFKLLDDNKNEGGVMSADKKHLHHRYLDHNKSQSRTAIYFYWVAFALGVLGVIISLFKNFIPGLALVLLLLSFSVIIQRVAVIEIWNSTRLIFHGFRRPRKSVLLNMLHPLWDMGVFIIAVLSAVYILDIQVLLSIDVIMLCVAPIMFSLFLSRNYKIFWLRADVNDYLLLLKLLSVGYLLVFLFVFIYIKHFEININTLLIFHLCLLAYLFTVFGIIGERFGLRWLQTALVRYVNESHLNKESVPVLIFGGGLNACLYLRQKNSAAREEFTRVVGIVDDDPALKGLFVYGSRVRGNIRNLEEIYKKTPFLKIIVTTDKIRKGSKRKLLKFCKKHDVEVLYFSCVVQPYSTSNDSD